jgi:hypothetical protein
MSDAVIDWLLAGDPAIRWQVLRDLTDAPARTVARERRAVGAGNDWAARLLARQGADGRWAADQGGNGGLYTPKWTSTTYTMLLLRDCGLAAPNASATRACAQLLAHGRQDDGGIGYGPRTASETCITGMVLSIVSAFAFDDDRVDHIVDHLLEHQLADGGWNCRWRQGPTHSSVNTTISALEGLRCFTAHRPYKARLVQAAAQRGREFLLVHHLYRSHRTGRVMKPEFTRFVFPPRWHYDVLRALDHFRDVDAPRDARLEDAIALVHAAQHADGRWRLRYAYRGSTYFTMERVGAPSRWNTLRALRVLRWWERGH